MSDLDRYLTEEVVERGGDLVADVLDSHGHNGVDCRPDAGFDLHCAEAFRASLAAVLPGIIQQAKAEALESLLGRLPELVRPYAGSTEFWEGYINAVKAEAWEEALQARAAWMQNQRYYVEDEVPNPYRADQIEQGGQP